MVAYDRLPTANDAAESEMNIIEAEKGEDDVFVIDDNDETSSTSSTKTNTKTKTDETPKTAVASPRVGGACRGIGIMLVVVFHMGYKLFANAWINISLFFSLSGFLITKTTIEGFERHGHVDIVKFWAKRVSRIFPCALLAIILIVLSQKLPFRHNDGVTYQREATDLWYATIFLTNYNLVYKQPDDYFDEFAPPSITRHLWTLSIEEQYYIIWPLLIWSMAWLVMRIFGKDVGKESKSLTISEDSMSLTAEHGIDSEQQQEKHQDYKPWLLESTTVRNLLRSVLILDLCVMILSYFSSFATIDAMGLTAAYYSTWCRMGDIASGGFAYSFTRLQPYIARRFYNDPTLPSMTKKERVGYEILSCTQIASSVFLSMIQLPVLDMQIMYFNYLRIPLSLVCFSMVGTTIQLYEDVPSWAIATKFMNNKFMLLMGTISYGAYIIHWPLLVYFGDPKGANRHQVAAGVDFDQVLTVPQFHMLNVFFFILTFALAVVSFFRFELPCVEKSRVSKPWKTVTTGLFSMGLTLIIIWLVTKDLPPAISFENDVGNDISSYSVDTLGSLHGNTELNRTELNLAYEEMRLDFRLTPVLMVSDIDDVNYQLWDMLDGNSMLPKRFHKDYDELMEEHDVLESTDSNIIIQCKNQAEKSPCYMDKLNDESYWFWLESDRLCGDSPIAADFDFDESCPDKFEIAEIKLLQPLSEDPFDTKNQTEVKIQLYEMLRAIRDLQPKIMNLQFVFKYEFDYDLLLGGYDEHPPPIRITMIGESVSNRIGGFWEDYLNNRMPVLPEILKEAGYNFDQISMPQLNSIKNYALGGRTAIAYFLCKSQDPSYQYDFCDHFRKPDVIKSVLNCFYITYPDIVAIHDTHWSLRTSEDEDADEEMKEEHLDEDKIALDTRFDRVLAFNIMASEAVSSGAGTIVFMTQSPELKPVTGNNAADKYFQEMDTVMDTIDTLGCPADSDGSIKINVVNWAKLVCPHIGDGEEEQCEKYHVHGLDDILPDGKHPYGDSGDWLTREMLSMVLAKYGVDNGYYSTFDEALHNPMSEDLLTLAPPDGNPPLEDLVTSYTICPFDDYKRLEEVLEETPAKEYTTYRDGKYITFP